MSNTESLKIYKDTYRLVNILMDNMQNMPVKHRRTLGDRLLNVGYDALMYVHNANCAITKEERIACLDKFLTDMNVMNAYLRIANEHRFFSLTQSTMMFELTNGIMKQIAGWRKYTANK